MGLTHENGAPLHTKTWPRGSILLLALFLAACVSPTPAPVAQPVPQHTATVQPLPSASPTRTASPEASSTPQPSPSPSATATELSFALCSPLEGIELADLGKPDLLKNPFQAPRPGMDDGHHGTDFAYYSLGERKEMLGHPVHSVLNGKVAGVILNRPPYGNAVIIETPLEDTPSAWLERLQAPTPAPTVPPSALVCPPPPADTRYSEARSLYLLYAHLNQAPVIAAGQRVTCGQPIGEVGTSGNSVNPHLHLETRYGPSGFSFPAMAHYDNAATDEERGNYCTWRVSGLFQMVDPMQLLSLQP